MKKFFFVGLLFFLALAIQAQVVAVRPDRARALAQADSLTRLMQYDAAASRLAAVLEADSGDVETLSKLADVHFQAGNLRDAATAYRLLSSFHPADPFYRIRESRVRFKLGEYADAVSAGKSALASAGSPALLVLVGNAFNLLQQRDSAQTYYRKALALNPAHEPAVSNLASLLLERKAYSAVVSLCKSYLDTVHFQMHGPAAIFRGARITPELRDSVTFTCDVSPDKALPVLQTRGLAESLLKEYAASIRTFEALLAAGDSSYATHYYLGLDYLENSAPTLAAEQFEAAYALDSSDVNLVLNYARALSRTKHRPGQVHPGAKRLFDRALQMLEPDPSRLYNIHYQYAYAYHLEEDFASAIPHYKAAWAANPSAISCLSSLGYCYERLKDWKNAKTWYEQYRALGKPGTTGHDYVLQALKYVDSQLFMEK